MTNILIPTDFTPAGFQMTAQAIERFKGRKLNIMLFHAFEMPDAFDLLDRNRPKPYHNLLTETFRQSCRQIKEQYPKEVHKIAFNCMEGNSASMFRNFVEAHEIDCIVCPGSYRFVPANKKSVDPLPLFRKSGVRMVSDLQPRVRTIDPGVAEMPIPALLVAN